MNKEKILLLYLKTGGGHLAPARSIASQLQKINPDIEPVLINGFEKTPEVVRYVIEDGYRKVQYNAKWFYELLYAVNKIKFMAEIVAGIISFVSKDYISEVIEKEKPSKIVIFHFFLIKPVYAVLPKDTNIKVYTLVTDPFTAHPLWFLNKKQNFIIFSERLKNHCLSLGITEERLKVFPFVLNEKFTFFPLSDQETDSLKNKYDVNKGKKVVLVLGGGDGIPKGKKILSILLNNFKDIKIILIAGKNKRLYKHGSKLKEKFTSADLQVYGYVDFIYDLINISDAVITKCGASTFMEIVISGKIPVVTDYIWEQEKGNKEFIVQNGMGVYVRSLRDLPESLNTVFMNKKFYQENIRKMNLKNGAAETAAYISR